MSTLSGWCIEANAGTCPAWVAAIKHHTCRERIADPVQLPSDCGCHCHESNTPHRGGMIQ